MGMMSFLNDLPYMLGQRYVNARFEECYAEDGDQQGWHIILGNGWRISVQDLKWEPGLSIMARPDFDGSMFYNFGEDLGVDPDDIDDILGQLVPHEVMRWIKRIGELPGEIPSDNPDPLDVQ